jgi:hypothetical protein
MQNNCCGTIDLLFVNKKIALKNQLNWTGPIHEPAMPRLDKKHTIGELFERAFI